MKTAVQLERRNYSVSYRPSLPLRHTTPRLAAVISCYLFFFRVQPKRRGGRHGDGRAAVTSRR